MRSFKQYNLNIHVCIVSILKIQTLSRMGKNKKYLCVLTV